MHVCVCVCVRVRLAPPPPPSLPAYPLPPSYHQAAIDTLVQKVGLEDKQQDLAEYLTGEHKLLELCQMDDDDLTEDILEECLQLDEAARNRFRQAVVAITAAQRLQAGGTSAADRRRARACSLPALCPDPAGL